MQYPYFFWWRRWGSNPRPLECKSSALPAELHPQSLVKDQIMVGLSGLEPLTPALSERCSNQLSYKPKL